MTIRRASFALFRFTVILFLACLTAATANSATNIHTLADITGDGSSHAIAATGTARWIQLVADSANTANVRWGDCGNISASRGGIVAKGAGQFLPPLPAEGYSGNRFYSLAQVCYIAQTGDKLYITWSE